VARFSDTIDPETRTVGVIVEVDRPYEDIQPGVRPPLVKGMFVYVELRGRARPQQLVVPRSALHGDELYVVDGEDRLHKRKVEVGSKNPEYMTIKKGIDSGERIVVSDLVPAIEGMLIRPVPDEKALEQLIREAGGEDEPL
jgi:multidrug efflux pump subunit AcrA (membrane-fusion protein)